MVILILGEHDNPFPRIFNDLQGIKEALTHMATQQGIDDLTKLETDNQAATVAAIADSKASLTATVAAEHDEVMAAFAAWQASHPDVDISALKAAVSGSKDNVAAAIADETTGLTASVQGIITPDAPAPDAPPAQP